MNRYIKATLIGFFVISLFSCNDTNKEKDTTPPGKIVVTDIVPTNGGAKIAYTLPSDSDILFVKAKYRTTLDKEVFKSVSYYLDTIEVDGFNETGPQNVELFVVDRNNNHSEGLTVEVTPLESYIHLVQKSITVEPGFGNAKVSWENTLGKLVHVKFIYESIHGIDSILHTSDDEFVFGKIEGLDSVNYEFNSVVEDAHENVTDKKFAGDVKPRYEEEINKEDWTLVRELSVDGNAWEGVTENFWDNIVDTKESPDDNSYFIINRDDNGGSLSYPMDIVIDLNKQVIINRLKVWQRAYSYPGNGDGTSNEPYYYQVENMRSFEIYISNDQTEWTLAGTFDIGDPKDDDGNIPKEFISWAESGHDFDLEQESAPFRYLKFSITSNYGSETNIYGSELTLYGLDNVQ